MKIKSEKFIIVLSLSIFGVLSSLSCASSTNGNFNSDSLHKKSDKYFSFYEDENGKSVHWEVNFKDEVISSVYRDGNKISSENLDEYRKIINEKLDELRFGIRDQGSKIDHFTIDMDEFRVDMEHLRERLHNRIDFHNDFNEKEFNKNMEELKEELKKLEDLKFYIRFDSEEFKKQMEDLNKQLSDHQINFDFDIDELKEIVEEHQLNADDINIDLNDLDINIEKLDKELKELDIDLEKLNEELKKFDEFIDTLKEELVADGFIENKNENVEIKLSASEMIVDGKKLSPALLVKDKNMYKKYMKKSINETSSIHIY